MRKGTMIVCVHLSMWGKTNTASREATGHIAAHLVTLEYVGF